MARLDSTASRSYQCAPLRKRVLSVCRRGVEMMGASTRSLVDEYPLRKNDTLIVHVLKNCSELL